MAGGKSDFTGRDEVRNLGATDRNELTSYDDSGVEGSQFFIFLGENSLSLFEADSMEKERMVISVRRGVTEGQGPRR